MISGARPFFGERFTVVILRMLISLRIDWNKMKVRKGAAVVTNRNFQNGETTCRHLSKDPGTTAPTVLLRQQTPTWHCTFIDIWRVRLDAVVYSDPMPCMQTIVGEDTEPSLIHHTISHPPITPPPPPPPHTHTHTPRTHTPPPHPTPTSTHPQPLLNVVIEAVNNDHWIHDSRCHGSTSYSCQ